MKFFQNQTKKNKGIDLIATESVYEMSKEQAGTVRGGVLKSRHDTIKNSIGNIR